MAAGAAPAPVPGPVPAQGPNDQARPNRMQELVRVVMDRLGVDPSSVIGRLRLINVRFAVFFRCERCRKNWTSAWGWFTVDFRQQRIKRRWRQGCNGCGDKCRPMIRDMEAFADFAVARYIELRDRDPNAPPPPRREPRVAGQPPHLKELCEKCEYGRFKCWLPRNAQDQA